MTRVLMLMLCVGALSGCERPPEPHAGVAMAAQIAAVRAGRADTLVALEPTTEEQWQTVATLDGLRELVVHAGGASDAAVTALARLPRLERLVLRQSPVTDEGFRALATCPSLRDLNVPQAACTSAGIRALTALPSLHSLRIGGPNLHDADVAAALAAIHGLRSLHLIDVPLGDAGLAVVATLPQLRNLYLDGASVSDAAWDRFFRDHPDVHVHVDQSHHDRDPRRDD